MAKMGRPGRSDEHEHDVWDRWGKGQSISTATPSGQPPGSNLTLLGDRGGFAPPERTRRTDGVPEPG